MRTLFAHKKIYLKKFCEVTYAQGLLEFKFEVSLYYDIHKTFIQ